MPHTAVLKQYVFALLVALLFNSSLAHSLAIVLDPVATIAGTGDQVSFDLNISGLGDLSAPSLGAFDISVGFDPTRLSFTGYSLGDSLGRVDLFEALDFSGGDTGGAVNLTEVSLLATAVLDALQFSDFILATLIFNVDDLAAGESTELSTLPGAILSDALGARLQVSEFGTASVRGAEDVPVPGTPLLFLAAMIGWMSARRTRVAESQKPVATASNH